MKIEVIFAIGALAASAGVVAEQPKELNPLKLSPHHAAVSVADLDRESQWYAQVLGLEKTFSYDNGDLKGCFMYVPGGGFRIDLMQQKGSERESKRIGLMRQGWLHVVFQTPLMDEALKRLRLFNTDVQVYRYKDGRLQRLVVHDPEGNEIELHAYDGIGPPAQPAAQ